LLGFESRHPGSGSESIVFSESSGVPSEQRVGCSVARSEELREEKLLDSELGGKEWLTGGLRDAASV
jgi:hypothetical protein